MERVKERWIRSHEERIKKKCNNNTLKFILNRSLLKIKLRIISIINVNIFLIKLVKKFILRQDIFKKGGMLIEVLKYYYFLF